MGAKMIGRALTPNKSLTTLNLCYNKITCEGAACIAKVRKGQRGKSLNTDSITYYMWPKSNWTVTLKNCLIVFIKNLICKLKPVNLICKSNKYTYTNFYSCLSKEVFWFSIICHMNDKNEIALIQTIMILFLAGIKNEQNPVIS